MILQGAAVLVVVVPIVALSLRRSPCWSPLAVTAVALLATWIATYPSPSALGDQDIWSSRRPYRATVAYAEKPTPGHAWYPACPLRSSVELHSLDVSLHDSGLRSREGGHSDNAEASRTATRGPSPDVRGVVACAAGLRSR